MDGPALSRPGANKKMGFLTAIYGLQVKPYRYHTVTPFSSHAPAYDSSLSSFSKEDSDLLYEVSTSYSSDKQYLSLFKMLTRSLKLSSVLKKSNYVII